MMNVENTEVRVYRCQVIKTAFNYLYELSRLFQPNSGSTISIIYHESHYPNSQIFITRLKKEWAVC